MKKKKVKLTGQLTEGQIQEFIGKIAKWMFNRKGEKIAKAMIADPRFKAALDDYVAGTREFEKTLKDLYGVSSPDDLQRVAKERGLRPLKRY